MEKNEEFASKISVSNDEIRKAVHAGWLEMDA